MSRSGKPRMISLLIPCFRSEFAETGSLWTGSTTTQSGAFVVSVAASVSCRYVKGLRGDLAEYSHGFDVESRESVRKAAWRHSVLCWPPK